MGEERYVGYNEELIINLFDSANSINYQFTVGINNPKTFNFTTKDCERRDMPAMRKPSKTFKNPIIYHQ